MPAPRTTLTEVATALGCLELPTLEWAVLRRPEIAGVSSTDWDQIDSGLGDPQSHAIGLAAFANGQHFGRHRSGLDRRTPRLIEWTGGRRPPGDQVVPADLRIDHVYLVSCKYLSKIVLNTAPAKLFDVLLQPGVAHDPDDWFSAIAPKEYAAFAAASQEYFGLGPSGASGGLSATSRRHLKLSFKRAGARLPDELRPLYSDLCAVTSHRSAQRWRSSVPARGPLAESLLWRLLRIGSGTYFVLGVSDTKQSLRLRVMTPWDWRQAFELRCFDIEPADAGQPQVLWRAVVRDRAADVDRVVEGHVEIRWSHGRFGSPPEAKVYLDTPHADVPGYVPLA